MCDAIDNCSHDENQDGGKMWFKRWDARNLEVKTNKRSQKCHEKGKKHMKCFEETECVITGTYTQKKKKTLSFNITFASKQNKIKIPQNPLKFLNKKANTFSFIRFLF